MVSQEQRERTALLKETNANISYLILVSCLGLTLCLTLYIGNAVAHAGIGVLTFLFSHFILTLLMIIKRMYALFRREYEVT